MGHCQNGCWFRENLDLPEDRAIERNQAVLPVAARGHKEPEWMCNAMVQGADGPDLARSGRGDGMRRAYRGRCETNCLIDRIDGPRSAARVTARHQLSLWHREREVD